MISVPCIWRRRTEITMKADEIHVLDVLRDRTLAVLFVGLQQQDGPLIYLTSTIIWDVSWML